MNCRAGRVVVATLLVAACAACGESASEETTATTADAATPGSSAAVAGFPVTVADCKGLSQTYPAPPNRIVSLSASAMETLYWLGVGDRIVGTAEGPYTETQFPTQFRAAAKSVEVIADPYVPGQDYLGVTFERLLAKQADFVYSDFTTTFVSFSQAELKDRGIPSYLSFSTDCPEAGAQTNLDLVYKEIRDVGQILGRSTEAEAVVAAMQNKLADVAANVGSRPKPRVLYLGGDSITAEAPSSAIGNRHVVNAILGLAGAENVFDNLDTGYQEVGWEEMAAQNPDVIVLTVGNYVEGDYQQVIDKAKTVLREHPATRNLAAVVNDRIVDIDAWLTGAGGVRNADAVVDLARKFHPDAFS